MLTHCDDSAHVTVPVPVPVTKCSAGIQMLVEGFNVAAADGVMCRNTVNVGWDGRVFDCDFNQQLDMGIRYAERCAVQSDNKGLHLCFNADFTDWQHGSAVT